MREQGNAHLRTNVSGDKSSLLCVKNNMSTPLRDLRMWYCDQARASHCANRHCKLVLETFDRRKYTKVIKKLQKIRTLKRMRTVTEPIVVETNCERKGPQRQEKSLGVIQINVLHKITCRLWKFSCPFNEETPWNTPLGHKYQQMS